MATSALEIRSWINRGIAEKATHVLVVCDTFDWEDYPVYVMPGEDARSMAEEHGYNGDRNMQRVMEVYNLALPIEPQLDPARRCFNF